MDSRSALQFKSIGRSWALIVVTTLTAILLPGCTDFGSGSVYSDPAGLTLVVEGAGMIVTNNTSGTVNFFAVEKNLTPLIDWILRCDGATAIEIGHTKEIDYSGMIGYFRGCELVFYWWHCSPVAGDGGVPGVIHSIVLQTPSYERGVFS